MGRAFSCFAPPASQKRLIVQARKDERTVWKWAGGYIECGVHHDRPYFRRVTSHGGQVHFIFYHPSWDAWFISETLGEGTRITYCTKSTSAAIAPELASWGEDKVQSIVVKEDRVETLFVDYEFPHRPGSINRAGGAKPVKFTQGEPEWVPGRRLREAEWRLFEGIDPKDLLQGRLGNCWLIAAMAALAEFPKEVEKLFVRDGLEEGDGKYIIAVYDHRRKCVRQVTVDEYIPCRPRRWWDVEAEPYFAKPNGNELWCLILEKAMAKVFGSYGELACGTPAAAFRALTGHQEQIRWTWDQERGAWGKSTLAEGSTDKFITQVFGQERRAPDDFFEHLRECDARSYLMTSGIKGESEKEREDGLVEGHTYSLIQVVSVDTSSGGEKLRMLELRNPWGRGREWKGPWSDGHELWDRHPEVREHLRPQYADDGAFWMDWESFSRIFTTVFICPKAMRQGEEAEEHGLASTDWTKFKARQSALRVPAGRRTVRPSTHAAAVAMAAHISEVVQMPVRREDSVRELHWQVQRPGLCGRLARCFQGEGPPSRLVLCLERGQYWEDLEDRVQVLLAAAMKHGDHSARVRMQGGDFEVDFNEYVLRDLRTGTEWPLRCAQLVEAEAGTPGTGRGPGRPATAYTTRAVSQATIASTATTTTVASVGSRVGGAASASDRAAGVDLNFVPGQAVELWSPSRKIWQKDWTVVDVLDADTDVDGQVWPAGSVKIARNNGNFSRWLDPDQLAGNLRPDAEAVAAPPAGVEMVPLAAGGESASQPLLSAPEGAPTEA